MGEPVKLVIVLEAGRVHDVLSCGLPIEVAVIDYDCGGGGRYVSIPQYGSDRRERAIVSMWRAQGCDFDTEHTLTLFELVRKASAEARGLRAVEAV